MHVDASSSRRDRARRWYAPLALSTSLTAWACDPPPNDEDGRSGSLVDHRDWTSTPEHDDPLADHRPAELACERSFVPEGQGIEIDTGRCSYVSLSQPLRRAVRHGEPLGLRMWWATLASDAPAHGHLALLVDGELLWDEWVAIPGAADVVDLEFESPLDAEVGADLTFHLHNHGYNTWTFERLEALAKE